MKRMGAWSALAVGSGPRASARLEGQVVDALGRLDEARAAFDRADALLRS